MTELKNGLLAPYMGVLRGKDADEVRDLLDSMETKQFVSTYRKKSPSYLRISRLKRRYLVECGILDLDTRNKSYRCTKHRKMGTMSFRGFVNHLRFNHPKVWKGACEYAEVEMSKGAEDQ